MSFKKIVFFEEINSSFYPIMIRYLNDNFTVHTFKIDKKYEEREEIKKFLDEGNIIDLSNSTIEYALTRLATYYAYENVDVIFQKFYSNSIFIALMEKLLDYPGITKMHKKVLLIKLEEIYNMTLRINGIIQNEDTEVIHFHPSMNQKLYTDERYMLNERVEIIQLKKINRFNEKVKAIFSLRLPVFIFLKKCRWPSKNKQKKKFKVGVMVDHPKSIFAMNYYFLESYLIDEEELSKEDVLFIDDSKRTNIEDYKRWGYNYTRLIEDKEVISWNLFRNKIFNRFFPTWFKSLILSFFEESFIVDVNKSILSDYIIWNVFVDSYDIKNYFKRFNPDNISKTYILSNNNITTWLCYSDFTSIDFYLDWDEKKKMRNHTLYSYFYYDKLIISGKIIKRYFEKYKNDIKEYISIGIILSQPINEVRNGKTKSRLPELIRRKNLSGKIVGIFDTTFVDYGPIKIKEGIKFGNDVLQLLNDFPNISIIFKAKKELELTPPLLVPIYEKLKKHDRCLFIARYDKEGISAMDVIAHSDFVISTAYTSTTTEALGAKVKAIYYEPGGHDLGDKYCLNRIPNFVAHDYDELKRLINYWLYEVTDEEFGTFLNKYVKGEMDAYLDGKALTRLRKLLIT